MTELQDFNSRGLFIVLYASNNLGKSVQAKKLASKFILESKQILVIKYPLYKLEPTGPFIDSVLRRPEEVGRKVEEEEFQGFYAQNRRDFQETLINTLNAGISVIAEDYTGTGLAWGLTRDVPLEKLEEMNKDLIKPDLAILLDGERFVTGVEKKHRNESAGEQIWLKNRKKHLFLAERYGWKVIHANQSEEDVAKDLCKIVDNYADFIGYPISICNIKD